MSQTMRALVKREATEGIWMEEIPVLSPGTNVKRESIADIVHELGIYGRRMYETWYKMTRR